MGRRVLVTGASGGIGQAIASRLAKDGFEVAVHYGHNEAGAQETLDAVKAQGGQGYLISFDVADAQECEEKLACDVEEHGAYYGIVCNAGITRDEPFPGMSLESWMSVINTNLNSFYNVVHPLIMPMVRAKMGGRIIAVSSVSGQIGNRGQTNYAASKAGLIGAVKSLALELGKRKITVNAISPGLIETKMTELDPQILDEILKMIPLRRQGRAEEVASLASYLMSDEAAYITRQVIAINGGLA